MKQNDLNNISIDNFVEQYNKIAETKIEGLESFTVNDKASDYYRTEFRLFRDAEGKHASFGNYSIDLIKVNGLTSKFRIYLIADSYNKLVDFVKKSAPILSNDITDEEIDSALEETQNGTWSISFLIGKDLSCTYQTLGSNGACEIMIDKDI